MSSQHLPQETVHVNRMIVRIPNPEKFFEIFTARQTRLSTREFQEVLKNDPLVGVIGNIGEKINGILSVILSDMDPPPAVILHPDYGRPIVYDRIARIFTKARVVLESEIANVERELREKKSEHEVKRAIMSFLLNIKIINLALREAISRQLIIYYSNLPAEMRPPTANIILGFDPYAPRR